MDTRLHNQCDDGFCMACNQDAWEARTPEEREAHLLREIERLKETFRNLIVECDDLLINLGFGVYDTDHISPSIPLAAKEHMPTFIPALREAYAALSKFKAPATPTRSVGE